jgi:c-di-GMP-binding flagellar brake protein YcgR
LNYFLAELVTRHTRLNIGDSEEKIIRFPQARLNIGDSVKLQPQSGLSQSYYSRLIGLVEKCSFLVTAPIVDGNRLPVSEDQVFGVRVFSKKSIYAFNSIVLCVCTLPYPYLHLSCPELVQAIGTRRAYRLKINTECLLSRVDQEDSVTRFHCIATNISTAGALVSACRDLAEVNDILEISIPLKMEKASILFNSKAIVRNLKPNDTPKDSGTSFQYGLEFLDTKIEDRVLLEEYILKTFWRLWVGFAH